MCTHDTIAHSVTTYTLENAKAIMIKVHDIGCRVKFYSVFNSVNKVSDSASL